MPTTNSGGEDQQDDLEVAVADGKPAVRILCMAGTVRDCDRLVAPRARPRPARAGCRSDARAPRGTSRALRGRSPYGCEIRQARSFHPGERFVDRRDRSSVARSVGNDFSRFPLTSYPMQTLISSKVSSTSSLVTAIRSMPLIMAEYLQGDGVEPAAPPGTAGGGAELMAGRRGAVRRSRRSVRSGTGRCPTRVQ